MIIWSGLGFLPVIFLIILSIAFGAGDKTSNQDKEIAYALFVTGLLSGALGWWLQNRPGRHLIDQATGREIILRRRHSLFFIPMIYWCPIFIGIAIYVFVQAAKN